MKAKEGKATEELRALLEASAEKFYGMKPIGEADLNSDDDDEEVDIEAAIKREMEGLKPADKTAKDKRLFAPVFLDVQCVLFFKINPDAAGGKGKEIDPVEFVQKIADDALARAKRTHRFLNRLTPMSLMGRATEEGLREVGRAVLSQFFELEGEEGGDEKKDVTYAIRPTIRNHSNLKRNVVIDTIAGLIGKKHKVDLGNPDKVVLVEVYQNVLGMAVVGAKEWESGKRWNLNEIYTPTEVRKAEAAKEKEGQAEGEGKGKEEKVVNEEEIKLDEKVVAKEEK